MYNLNVNRNRLIEKRLRIMVCLKVTFDSFGLFSRAQLKTESKMASLDDCTDKVTLNSEASSPTRASRCNRSATKSPSLLHKQQGEATSTTSLRCSVSVQHFT